MKTVTQKNNNRLVLGETLSPAPKLPDMIDRKKVFKIIRQKLQEVEDLESVEFKEIPDDYPKASKVLKELLTLM